MAKKGKVKTTNKRTRNNTANKTKRKTKNTTKPDERDPIIEDEIILIITLLISVLIFLSYFDLSGQVGVVISGLIFGMIGSLSYLLPFVLFFAIAFYLSNRGNKIARRRLISLVVFFVSLTAFIQLLTLSYNPEMKIQEYYKSSALLRRGGGIIGGIQVKIYYGLFDKLASYIILIAIMTITIMIITGKAIISNLKKLSSYLVNKGQESWKAHRMEEDHDTTELEEDYDNKRPSRAPAKTVDIKPKDLEAHFFRKSSKDKVHKEKPNKNKLKKQYKKEKQLEKENNIEAESHSYIEEELANKFGRVSTNIEKDQEVAEIKKSEKSVVEGKTIHVNKPAKASQPKNIIKANSMPQAIEEESVIEHTLSNVEINNIYEQKPEDEKLISEIDKPIQVERKKAEEEDSKTGDYIHPPIELLEEAKNKSKGIANESLKETALKLQTTLESFGVKVEISNISCGPSVTRYELQPEQGVKVSKITSLADDIKLNLAAADIRIEAPIPGKAAVGIEVPNKVNSMVSLRGMIESDAFDSHPSNISFVVGKDIGGKEVIADIGSMPHLLIAGATGSGKSVCINTIIMSIIYKSSPDDVKLIMIDPKIVELSSYNGIPHLMIPVVTDPKKASNALFWAVSEMTDRYKKFASVNARDMKGYNKIIEEDEYKDNIEHTRLPQIVIIIDELADLMMVAPGEVEDSICRLAQMARAAGIHLIIATQRPSVNVITGLIKANIPSRIAFAVSSAIDSRTILDGSGAEKLLGRGDMLFFPAGYPKPIRVQGAFVSDKEVRETVKFIKEHNSTNDQTPYSEDVAEKILSEIPVASAGIPDERDEYFAEVGKFIIEKEQSSIGMIQRVYRVGFNRAARIMDQLEAAGLVGPSEGTKAREILMTMDEFEHWLEENKAG